MHKPASAPLANLPSFASRFIGREKEIGQLAGLLARTRLVTLAGAPGTGKTRLAIEVARAAAETKPDGAYLVELGALTEGRLIPEALAASVGISQREDADMLETLVDRLGAMNALLVVDNCEHLVEATAAVVDRIIRRCDGVTVMTTSREPLRIDGETVWPVSPLHAPAERSSLTEMRRSEAVQLFAERARQIKPGFELNSENAAQVAAVCRRLDGLPLAIELAAARISSMDVGSILDQLNDRFRFLTSGFRTAPERHRTLRAAIDWSYELLTSGERQLLVRASAFAGTFDVLDARAVCAGGAVLDEHVLEFLARLVDRSLVAALAPARYRLLETVRAYALERLREGGEQESVRRKHAEHFAVLAQGGWDTADPSWLTRLRRDVDNMREALAWSREGDADLHLRLATAFGIYCTRASFMSEGWSWLEPALRTPAHDPALSVRANEVAALLAWRQGKLDIGAAHAAKAVDLARHLDDERVLAEALGFLSFILIGALSFDAAAASVDELLSIARTRGDRSMEADGWCYLGLLKAHGEDVSGARDLLIRSAAQREAEGRSDETALQHNVLGWLHLRSQEVGSARREIDRGLRIRIRHQDAADIASSLDAAAELAFAERAPERAMRLSGAADSVRDSLGSVPPSLALASRARWLPRAQKLLAKRAHAAWLEGRSLSLDEAVRYALGGAAEPPPRTSRDGDVALSTREMEVVELVTGGMSNDEIATRLKLSRRTVEAHVDHARAKLGARSRVELATWFASRSSP